ncbi:type II toxin-antitoxin system Phd/YefM family antitoxin [Glutamicibacter sp.]
MTTLSITEATSSGFSALVTAAEEGRGTALSRHGKVVAEVVSAAEIA